MNRLVDVTANVIGQVITGNTHQVVGDHAGVIGRILLSTDIGIDCRQTHGHGTGTVHGGLVDQLDFKISAFGPAHNFVGGTTTCHTTADQKNINFFFDDFRISKFTCHC